MAPRCLFMHECVLYRQMLYQDLDADGDENETAPQLGAQALGKGLAELDPKKKSDSCHER